MTKEEAKAIFEDLRGYKIVLSDLSANEQLELFDMAISALNGGWIPVTERLPEIGQRVLATIAYWDEHLEVRETTYDKYGFMCGNATAWQPLPEPYKAESKGDKE